MPEPIGHGVRVVQSAPNWTICHAETRTTWCASAAILPEPDLPSARTSKAWSAGSPDRAFCLEPDCPSAKTRTARCTDSAIHPEKARHGARATLNGTFHHAGTSNAQCVWSAICPELDHPSAQTHKARSMGIPIPSFRNQTIRPPESAQHGARASPCYAIRSNRTIRPLHPQCIVPPARNRTIRNAGTCIAQCIDRSIRPE